MRKTTAAIAIALVARIAQADAPPPVTPYERGLREFNLQHFQAALNSFQDAYESTQDAVFLYNMAQTQRQLGLFDAAARSYRAYLAQSSELTPVERMRIKSLAEQLEMEVAREIEIKALPPYQPLPPITAAPDMSAIIKAKLTTTPLSAAAAQLSARSSTRQNAIGWSLTAGGLAISSAALGLVIRANQVNDDIAQATTAAQTDRDQSMRDALRSASTALFVVGSATAAAGAIVLVVKTKRRLPRAAEVHGK